MGSCHILSILARVGFCGNFRCLHLYSQVGTLSAQLGWETTRFKLAALTSGHSLQLGSPQGHTVRHILALKNTMLQIFLAVLLSRYLLGKGQVCP